MEACMNQATVARYAASCSECEEVNYAIGDIPSACVACEECGADVDPLDFIHVDDVTAE